MAHPDPDTPVIHEPLADLEQRLISAYVAGAGEDLASLRARHDEGARTLLRQAAQYAAERLAEIEARSSYVHHLRGEA